MAPYHCPARPANLAAQELSKLSLLKFQLQNAKERLLKAVARGCSWDDIAVWHDRVEKLERQEVLASSAGSALVQVLPAADQYQRTALHLAVAELCDW
jgi:hypothetical protein